MKPDSEHPEIQQYKGVSDNSNIVSRTTNELQAIIEGSSNVITSVETTPPDLLELAQQTQRTLEKVEKLQKDVIQQGKTVERQKDDADRSTRKIETALDRSNTLVYLGFFVVIIMVAGMVLSAVFFEIQTINDNDKQTKLLIEQGATHSSSSASDIAGN